MVWIGPQGASSARRCSRAISLFYEGVPPSRAPKENALDLAAQQTHAIVTAPADLQRHRVARVALPRSRDSGPGVDVRARRSGACARSRPRTAPTASSARTSRRTTARSSTASREDFTWKLVGERTRSCWPIRRASPGQRDADGAARRRLSTRTWPTTRRSSATRTRSGRASHGRRSRPCWCSGSSGSSRRSRAIPTTSSIASSSPSIRRRFAGATSRKFDAQGALLRSLQSSLSARRSRSSAAARRLSLPASSMGYIAGREPEAGAARPWRAPCRPASRGARAAHPDRSRPLRLERLGAGK